MNACVVVPWLVLAQALLTVSAQASLVVETVIPTSDRAISEVRTAEVQFDGPVRGVDGSSIHLLDAGSVPPEVVISEFMADNQKTLHDEDGDPSDWIELFNGHDGIVSLEGWFLTDDARNLTKWRFPNVAIGANQFLIVFASAKNRTNATGRLHTNFKLGADGEYLALISQQTNVVSEFAPVYPPQLADVSYGRAQGAPENVGFFTRPTPGAPNSDNGPGFAPEVSYSLASRSFTSPFTLNLTSAASNAVLRYTLDGSLPTNSSPVYVTPLSITNSVQVRARAFQGGLLPGPPHTETYLLLSSNVVNFTSDLPVLVIHSLGKGAPTASRQTVAHLSVYEPVDGVTSLLNPPTLVTRFGIKIRGSSTEGLPKSSFAVEFWDEFNQDQHRDVLGLPAESDWVLYAPDSFEPVLIHNPFIHQLSRDLGRYSPRTRFVEVYLNKGTGAISAANYNGIYVLEEKIKIGPHRVAIDRLQPEHIQPPEVTGGYLLKIDRLDPGDTGLNAGGQTMAYVDPKEHDIRLPQRDPQEQYIKGYFNDFGRALNGVNWLNPVQGYQAFIDVDSWIDYHLVELLSGNVDALVLSTYFHKPREGKIVFGPHWDFDRALGSTDGRDANPRNWVTGPFFAGWWSRLFRDPDFWQKWIDRYEELRRSSFSNTNINALIDQLADEVRQAQPRERQRWHVALRGGSYQSEVNLMKTWLSNRMDFIDKQLVRPPTLSATGGQVTPGFVLSLSGPANGTVYYTLDGSDPRLAQGGLAPQAQSYGAPVTVTANLRIAARARNLAQKQTGGPPLSSPWSGLVTDTFVVRPPPLLLTEFMFHPAPPDLASTNLASDFEFLELKNVSTESVSLPGYKFISGIDFAFTNTNAVTQLAPGDRVLVVRDLSAFRARSPAATNVAGVFAGSLDSGSGRLALVGPLEEPIFDFTSDRSWQPLADGFGFSLVLAHDTVTVAGLQDPASWRLSAQAGGSPGELDPAPLVVPHVVVNELLPNPMPTMRDALELFNPTAHPADLSGWFLTDDFHVPKKFRLPDGLKVGPLDYISFTTFPAASGGIAFSKFGEQVYLFSADTSGNLTGWFHGFTFGAAEQGVSFGRYLKSTGDEAFVAQQTPTLGTANSGPRVGPLIINEIMFEPTADPSSPNTPASYIELRNTSAQPITLADPAHATNLWHLRGVVDFDFPSNTTVGAKGYLVLVGFDPVANLPALARFRSRYGFEAVASLLGPWHGHLESSGGAIRLLKPGEPHTQTSSGATTVAEILVEQVSYSGSPPWPAHTAATGLALLRRDSTAFADDPANWLAALPSPGDMDSDGDGLPDSWKVRNGLDPHSALGDNGPAGDPDHDGMSNAQEFLSGTAPRDAQSSLKLDSTRRQDGGIQLTFAVASGHSYTIEYRDSLTLGAWQILQSVLASTEPGTVDVLDTPTGRVRFYRLTTP